MGKKRSTYTIQFNCDQNQIEQLMQSYLNTNKFAVHEKKGEKYYRAGDQLIGFRGLLYNISNQTITITAWLDGALGNVSLDQKMPNALAMNYRNSLNTLFQELDNLNKGGNNMNSGSNNSVQNNNQQPAQNVNQQSMQNVNQQPVQSDSPQFANSFQNENTKKQETMCEIGFWLSLFGLIVSFFGVAMGLIIYIFDFYFASQGLKTKKRNKAIVTIVLSIISILVVVVQLIRG